MRGFSELMTEDPSTSEPGADPGQQAPQPAVPAGWYPHPTAPGWEAYWTGEGWGPDTRPAQPPAPAVPSGAQEQQAAQEAVVSEPVVSQDPVTAQEPAVAEPIAEPVAAEPVAAEPTPEPQTPEPTPEPQAPEPYTPETPVAAEPAVADPAAAVPASTEQHPATDAGGPPGAPPGAAATATAAAMPAAGGPAAARSDSSFPVILCALGALIAIVGAFLPEAKLDLNGTPIDLADNTMVAAGYGIAVIAAAVLGAAIAAWAYVKTKRTWIPVLLGVVILAIAVYAGTAGLDVTPDFAPQGVSIDDGGSPSTGIFAVGVGGLMMLLGGIGLARENR